MRIKYVTFLALLALPLAATPASAQFCLGGIDEEDDPFADVQFSRTVRTPVTTGSPQTIIGDLNATIQRQGDKIDRLEVRVEALTDQLSQIVEFLNGR